MDNNTESIGVDNHEQDSQKPLQDLFYSREKPIQKYGSENDIN